MVATRATHLLQKVIEVSEEEHRAAAIVLMLRRRAMIKEPYACEALQYRCSRWRRINGSVPPHSVCRAELAKKDFVLVADVRPPRALSPFRPPCCVHTQPIPPNLIRRAAPIKHWAFFAFGASAS